MDQPANTPMPTPIFTTSRLLVRPIYLNDAPSILHNANNSLVSQYMRNLFPYPYKLSDAETWIGICAVPQPNDFAICELSSPDVFIGGIGLKPGSDVNAHTAEVGYWIGEDYWGAGYATEVLDGFTKWSFEQWEKDGQRLRRLWAGVFGGNSASMRCLEKCGYSKEGVLKEHCEKNGEVLDLHLFGLTKADWEKRS